MPLYEYKCSLCGRTFEVIQKFSDEPVRVHAGCGGEVEKLFSAPAFHLKGTGWYATDYAKKNGKAATPDESGGDSKPKADGDSQAAKESPSGEGKSSEAKSSDSAASENKSSENKPAPKANPPTPAPESK